MVYIESKIVKKLIIGFPEELGCENLERDFNEVFEDPKKYSCMVDLDKVEENERNQSLTKFVDIFDPPEPEDIPQVWNQLKSLMRARANYPSI